MVAPFSRAGVNRQPHTTKEFRDITCKLQLPQSTLKNSRASNATRLCLVTEKVGRCTPNGSWTSLDFLPTPNTGWATSTRKHFAPHEWSLILAFTAALRSLKILVGMRAKRGHPHLCSSSSAPGRQATTSSIVPRSIAIWGGRGRQFHTNSANAFGLICATMQKRNTAHLLICASGTHMGLALAT